MSAHALVWPPAAENRSGCTSSNRGGRLSGVVSTAARSDIARMGTSIARMGSDRIPPRQRRKSAKGFFMRSSRSMLTTALVLALSHAAFSQTRLQSSDLLKLRSVTAVQLSPDGTRAAYVVDNNDGPGRPYGQLWVMTLADGKTVRVGADKDSS